MKPFEDHKQWSAVKDVCRRLRDRGHQALLAGGCVRDLLMNREPHDFDVATDALPDQVAEIFPNAILVGRAFGVIIVPFSGFQIEIATFREDLAYRDGRRPEGVIFSTPEADARRRDFTVNALFLDPESGQVFDHVNGRADLGSRIIRTVGEPDLRFAEDKLRLLRAVRFAAQLDFEIDPLTLAAIDRLAPSIRSVSRERVRDELLKLLRAPGRIKGLNLLLSTGLLAAAFPDATPLILKSKDIWLARFAVLESESSASKQPSQPSQPSELSERSEPSEPPEDALLLALFLKPAFDANPEQGFRERTMQDLRLDHRSSDSVYFLLSHLSDLLTAETRRSGDLAVLLARSEGPALEKLHSVEIKVQGWGDSLETQTRAVAIAKAKSHLGPERKLPQAFLNGSDLKATGIESGPRMGEILREAYLLQIEGRLSDRQAALQWLASLR